MVFEEGQLVRVRLDSPSSMRGCLGRVVEVKPGDASSPCVKVEIPAQFPDDSPEWIFCPKELEVPQGWPSCALKSREAVLDELLVIARDWADPDDPESLEDAQTLLEAIGHLRL